MVCGGFWKALTSVPKPRGARELLASFHICVLRGLLPHTKNGLEGVLQTSLMMHLYGTC